ncbi:MAG: porin [Deltaproteobacteria bacterium]|nr:porin [Deltaproteobacteria bacterium]
MKAHRIPGLLSSLGLIFLINTEHLAWAQAPAGIATPSTTSTVAVCPPAATSAVANLRATWPQALYSAAAACPAVVASPAAAPSPVAAATPIPPLTTPAVTGPLQFASPTPIDLTGVIGLSEAPKPIADLLKFDINGVVSGIGITQTHADNGDRTARADASNAQVIIQKADGLIQYFLEVGAYSFPIVGSPYISSGKAVDQLFSPLPVGYLKIAPNSNFSLLAGNLPTLFGAEYPFTFENINIERGLLWNQEPIISRGVQANYTFGPLSASLSWNDGFYSDSYTWLTGELAWAINSANTFSFVGGGNIGYSSFSNFATPVLANNSQIYDIIYTYSNAPWIFQPWFQFTIIPHHPDLGVFKTTSTSSAAILASYALTDKFFLGGRIEGINSTGTAANGSANVLYGPGSTAWSITLTPTYQFKNFFMRGEASFIQAVNYTSGDVFGSQNQHPTQVRGAIETGLLF